MPQFLSPSSVRNAAVDPGGFASLAASIRTWTGTKIGHENPMHVLLGGEGLAPTFISCEKIVVFLPKGSVHVFSSQAAIPVVQQSKLWYTLQLGSSSVSVDSVDSMGRDIGIWYPRGQLDKRVDLQLCTAMGGGFIFLMFIPTWGRFPF